MKTDQQGCSTCPVGQEQYEELKPMGLSIRGSSWIEYEYRKPTGELFTCIVKTLKQARQERDRWLLDLIRGNE